LLEGELGAEHDQRPAGADLQRVEETETVDDAGQAIDVVPREAAALGVRHRALGGRHRDRPQHTAV
jgi:hypothetical protein